MRRWPMWRPFCDVCCAALAVSLVVVPLAVAGTKPCCLPGAKPAVATSRYQRSHHPYAVPDLTLRDEEGRAVSVAALLASDKPVLVEFIFTTCTTICPVMSASFAQVQRLLGEEAKGVEMVSVTIDPDLDTPAQLQRYARRYEAGRQWHFLTGSAPQIHRLQRAFDAYTDNKMSHLPLTFLHAPGAEGWIRIEGLASAAELVAELREAAPRPEAAAR